MLEAVKRHIGKSVIISLDVKKSKQFLDPELEGSFNGTIISADEIGIYTRGFLVAYEERAYYKDLRELIDEKASEEQKLDVLKIYTDVAVIPWHAIVGISFVD